MLAGILGRVMQGRDSIVLRINPEKRDDDYRNYAGWTVVLYSAFALTRMCSERIGDERVRQDVVMALFNAFVGPERLTDFLSQSEPILRRMGQAYAARPEQGTVGAALLVHEYLFERAQPTSERIEAIVGLYTEVYNAGIGVLDRLPR